MAGTQASTPRPKQSSPAVDNAPSLGTRMRTRARNAKTTCIFAATVALASALPATALGAGWTVQSVPLPAGANAGALTSVSCASASACTTVGWKEDSPSEVVSAAESWNGSSWTDQSVPLPSGAKESRLEGVSCGTANACVAVGYSNEHSNFGAGGMPLAAVSNGSSWTLTSVPLPNASEEGYLRGVSCSSASTCVAVGYYFDSSVGWLPLAESWNGSTWTAQTAAVPSGALTSALYDASCASATACSAVGDYENSSDEFVPLAESWNGSSWSSQSVPSPSGVQEGTGVGLDGVACSLGNACAAVSGYIKSVHGEPVSLAESWSGSAWSVQSISAPSGALASGLSGVSCTVASACTAVGTYNNVAGEAVPLAESWNGSSWSPESPPAPSGAARSELESVSCTAASVCAAVGSYENGTNAGRFLVERDSGSVSVPHNMTAPSLTGTPAVGQTLTCSDGAWENEPTGYAYHWLRGGAAISGQEAATYVVQTADEGHSITCEVTASNQAGSASAVSGNALTAAATTPETKEPTTGTPTTSNPTAGAANTSGGNAGGGTTTKALTTAEVASFLSSLPTPKGKAASIKALLKSGGYTATFKAPGGGRLVVSWYDVPHGAHVSRAKAKPVLLATATASFAAAGTNDLKVKLTAAGKRLLRKAKRATLTQRAVFAATGGATLTKLRTLTLHR